jgi:hypothetical protein
MIDALIASDEPTPTPFLYSNRIGISNELIKVIEADAPGFSVEYEHGHDVVVGRLYY